MSHVKGIDNAVDEYIKENGGEDSFITGWILVASMSSPSHDSGLTDGYVTVTSDGLPHHVQLGLLQVAMQDKQSMAMVASMASMLGGIDEEDD
jgi:hypothetical protein